MDGLGTGRRIGSVWGCLMGNRVSERDLYAAVKALNEALGRPVSEFVDGKWQVGAFLASAAYGGWQLQEVCNSAGGVRAHSAGYVPKTELHRVVLAMVSGASAARGTGAADEPCKSCGGPAAGPDGRLCAECTQGEAERNGEDL